MVLAVSKEDAKLFEVHTPPAIIIDNHKDLSTGEKKVFEDDEEKRLGASSVIALRDILLLFGLLLSWHIHSIVVVVSLLPVVVATEREVNKLDS
mmetsp:Transcript_18224/g.44038  ORF Transcript_18224/g.44038 Transcript_18224/m.44038 type:complete len:94 (-) Transcript_18224:116-397(-)